MQDKISTKKWKKKKFEREKEDCFISGKKYRWYM